MRGNRGVSDVIAFTLMFTIIVASVAAVSTVGVDQLLEFRDREQINSAERAMEGFATSVDDIQRNGDPIRSVELTLDKGGVWVNDSTLRMKYDGSWEDISVGALQHYLSGNGAEVTITYEAGGVFRSDGLATYEPQLRCNPSSETAIVSVVNLTTDDSIHRAAGGGTRNLDNPLEIPGTVLAEDIEQSLSLTVEKVPSQSTVLTTTADGPVVLDVSQTAAPKQWGKYLEYKDGWSKVAGMDRQFKCSGSIATVLVRNTTVRISR